MKILDLSLTHHWFEEIKSGRKKEEYRIDKPFYKARLMDGYRKAGAFCMTRYQEYRACNQCNALKLRLCQYIQYDAVRFHKGQGGKETILVECNGIQYGYGKTEWGAPADKEVFIIRLGRILSDTTGDPIPQYEQ